MCKKSKHQDTEKKYEKDHATFRHLPEKTKNLMELGEKKEKSTGTQHVETTKEIDEESNK